MSDTNGLTEIAVTRALNAMGAQSYELGILHRRDSYSNQPGRTPGGLEPRAFMDLRQRLTREDILAAIPKLRVEQKTPDTHIYVRPFGNTNLTLVDDLKAAAVVRMRQDGFYPALVVQTSNGNYQAWVKHAAPLEKEIQQRVSRELAKRYDGDLKATGDRRFGRLPGFRNMKEKYKELVSRPDYHAWRDGNFARNNQGLWADRAGWADRTGNNAYTDERLHEIYGALKPLARYPFVTISEASGRVAERSPELIATATKELAHDRQEQARLQQHFSHTQNRGPAKAISEFRNDRRYDGDLSRADMAYTVHAAGRGLGDAEIERQIRTRDLSHHGSLQGQQAYLKRTIQKARQHLSVRMAQGLGL